ncbi:hypothetical protein GGX14DRAFT_676206 [Mycena pura]|uniref:DUF6534 domain-containing protein n=1 Tax=Mycena pura TaxID=153505 RepID=A0AAD6YHV8_9AGAR|nr:hypothetical protein GGX14DRAFT_676206 [Mycena pura]
MSAPEGLGSVISDAIQSVKELSAAAFIGYAVSTVAYGISVVQVYLYFRNYPKDSIFLKLTVAALWTLDTLSSIVMSHALYTLYVLNFNNLFADVKMPWSWPLSMAILVPQFILAIVGFSDATKITFRLRSTPPPLSSTDGKSGVLSLALVSCASSSFKYPALPSVAGLYLTVYLFQFPTVVSLFGHTTRSMTTIIESTGLVCDITITISLIYYLRSRKATGVRSTRDMIDSLIMNVMSRGILTAVCITLLFILLLGKLYVNSILATLNVRTSVRGKGQLEVSTRSTLRAMEFASGSGFTPHSDSRTANSGAGSGVCGLAQFYVWLQFFFKQKEFQVRVGIKSFPQIPPLRLDSSTINIL